MEFLKNSGLKVRMLWVKLCPTPNSYAQVLMLMTLDWDFTWKYISRYTLLRSRWDHTQVKWALGSIIMNKASGSDRIPAELFQILKGDAVKVLHSICQQIWKTQQWSQDWKRSGFNLIPKKSNDKECSNYHTITLISHASKVMLKILQVRLQQYMNWELSDVKLDLEKAKEPEPKLDHRKSKRIPEKLLFHWLH